MFVDAHAHLDKYDDKRIEEVLSEIEGRRILTMSVSVDPASFLRTESIAARSHLVVPSFGIHPEQAPDLRGLAHPRSRSWWIAPRRLGR